MKRSSQPTTKPFPPAIPLRRLIGPSFVILALGLGSGEVILWPSLASTYGLGIAWGALLGITFQYLINMEIERYALVKGESVFVGIARLFPIAPYWFLFSTFLGFGLPGIVAASATVFGALIGFDHVAILGSIFLLVIGMVLSLGKTVYGLMERLTKTILMIGVPVIFLLTLLVATQADWSALMRGMVGFGDGYRFLPAGISLTAFFAAFAYAGAGGNLNLTQSIYIKEKGYGMGAYAQKLGGLFRDGKGTTEVRLEGTPFADTPLNRQRFLQWWRRISIEHAMVFWFVGAISILLLMLLSASTTYTLTEKASGIGFVLQEASVIGVQIAPIAGLFFLLAVAVMLWQTQLGVLDSTSRIMAENAALTSIRRHQTQSVPLGKWYYYFLWAQIAFGILLFLLGLTEPKALLILGACLNAVAMFVHIGLVTVLNQKSLPMFYRPSRWRLCLLSIIFLFFGCFSLFVIADQIF